MVSIALPDNEAHMKGVRISTVEECDTILLPLVRSNEECNVGYLKTDSRRGALQSQAR
jgi:hypothetical protein